ncbi:MAG: Trm112 family protein [Oceanicaulis sp.]
MSDTSENSAGNPASDSASELDPKLLEILVCPVTRAPLVYDRKARELVSKQAGLAFPIREGVPIMLPEEARQLDD